MNLKIFFCIPPLFLNFNPNIILSVINAEQKTDRNIRGSKRDKAAADTKELFEERFKRRRTD